MHLHLLACQGATPHAPADDRLVPVDRVLDHAAVAVARPPLTGSAVSNIDSEVAHHSAMAGCGNWSQADAAPWPDRSLSGSMCDAVHISLRPGSHLSKFRRPCPQPSNPALLATSLSRVKLTHCQKGAGESAPRVSVLTTVNTRRRLTALSSRRGYLSVAWQSERATVRSCRTVPTLPTCSPPRRRVRFTPCSALGTFQRFAPVADKGLGSRVPSRTLHQSVSTSGCPAGHASGWR